MTTLDLPARRDVGADHRRAPALYGRLALIGLGGLFAGVTGPLVSNFVPPLVRDAGVLASLFLLCMALGGGIGDPLNGRLFDLFDGYRPLFLLMAGYTALAIVAVLFIRRGAGEAGTGPDSVPGVPGS